MEAAKAEAIAMKHLKEAVPVQTAAETSVTGGGGGCKTKKEPITLPKFSIEEKSGQPFLKYPIWLKNWQSHIADYKVKLRANMLMSHLDNEAQKHIISLENEYKQAMEELDKYYRDTGKVVTACMSEIRAHPAVNYKGLVSLKTCIKNNYARLKFYNLEHKVSNRHSMELILKFPIQENLEWMKHVAKTSMGIREKPFPSLWFG